MSNKSYKNEERKQKALQHNKNMETFSAFTEKSIANSQIIKTGKIPQKPLKKTVQIVKSTSEEAIFMPSLGKKAVLNFASFISPGGGFITGAIAQEEALCHASNLYNILSSDRFKEFYRDNKKPENYNNGLYNDSLIYTPNVLFFKELPSTSKSFFTEDADVITCAAPNWRAAQSHNVSYSDNVKALRSRIKAVLNAAECNKVENLILGAFGCGVFSQTPETVALIFKEELLNYQIPHVVFAIPDSDKLEVFQRVFSDNIMFSSRILQDSTTSGLEKS